MAQEQGLAARLSIRFARWPYILLRLQQTLHIMIGPIIFAIQAVENLLLEIQKDTYKDFYHIVAECYTFVATGNHAMYGHFGKKS